MRKVTHDKQEVKILKIKTIRTTKELKEFETNCNTVFLKNGVDIYVPSFCRLLRRTGG